MASIQHQAARHTENFPVASMLMPRHARKKLLACYDFLRGADNIADDPHTPLEVRHASLLALSDAINQHHRASLPVWAKAYQTQVAQDPTTHIYGQQLLQAFLQDTQKLRYATWDELIQYCSLSAMPVGRMVLHLCHEKDASVHAADALCAALQLLNHLQDIKSDAISLNRIYLPQTWLEQHHVDDTQLTAVHSSPGLRAVIDQTLGGIRPLLAEAGTLPSTLHSRRLRIEIRWMLNLANLLCEKLSLQDPLAHRVTLSRLAIIRCLWIAIWR